MLSIGSASTMAFAPAVSVPRGVARAVAPQMATSVEDMIGKYSVKDVVWDPPQPGDQVRHQLDAGG